jgi:hypothetical protein
MCVPPSDREIDEASGSTVHGEHRAQLWDRHFVVKAISQDSERQRLHAVDGFFARLASCYHAGKLWHFGDPAPQDIAYRP